MLFKSFKTVFVLLMLGMFSAAFAAEDVIWKFKDMTIDTATFKNPWKNIYSHSFYIFTDKAQDQAGKVVEFRADVTALAGSAPLRSDLRLNTEKGKKIGYTCKFTPVPAEIGKSVPMVCRFTVPKLEGIHNFNVSVAVIRPGDMHCSWQLKNIRFVSVPENEPAKK